MRVRVSLCLLLLLTTSCDDSPTGPAPGPPHLDRAVTLADWTPSGYDSPAARQALDDLVALGVRRVVFVPTAYQEGPLDVPASDPARTPTTVAMRAAIQAARARGLTVALKPHVDRNDGGWRGDIRPADPENWFAAYATFLDPWIGLAEQEGVDVFVVGTELAGTVEATSRWERMIERVRAGFAGRLTYAASWDEADKVSFWDRLDFVGIDFYVPVTQRLDAGRWEMLVGWQPWLRRLEILHAQTGLPIVLTEIGYRSVDGAGRRPFEFDAGGVEDPAEQADLYWAALQATSSHDWLTGLWWWNWLVSGRGGPGDLDYTPEAKPAASVLAEAWR